MEWSEGIKKLLEQKGFENITVRYFYYDVKKEHRYQIRFSYPEINNIDGLGMIFKCKSSKHLSYEEVLEKSGLKDYLTELILYKPEVVDLSKRFPYTLGHTNTRLQIPILIKNK